VVLGSFDLLPGPFDDAELCYTPIESILNDYGAELPRGAFQMDPPPPPPQADSRAVV
jgi:hypothetical protein